MGLINNIKAGGKKLIEGMKNIREDAWSNPDTGIGIPGKDKRMASQVQETFLDQKTLNALYQSDDMAARIIDRLPEDMMREGYEIQLGKILKLSEQVKQELERLDLNAKLEEAIKLARLYGGAGILIGISNQDPETPLDQRNIAEVEYLTVLDRYRLTSEPELNKDVTQKNFGFPEHYRVSSDAGETIIHHSRILRFDGVILPYELMVRNDYWGDSILSRLYLNLINYRSCFDISAALLQDFSQTVYRLKDLDSMITEGNGELLKERMKLVDYYRSTLNAIILDTEEGFERKSTSVAGLPELLQQFGKRMVSATDMPHTLLLGESPSGLGASGNSEKIDWYDHVKNKQQTLLKPKLRQLLDVLFSARRGPTQGKIPEYSIEFNPLWQLDLKEKTEVEKIRSEIDDKYIQNGVLDPQEVTKSRFGSGEFVHQTEIDWKLRKSFEENEEASPNVSQESASDPDQPNAQAEKKKALTEAPKASDN